MVAIEDTSRDHRNHKDSSSGHHECMTCPISVNLKEQKNRIKGYKRNQTNNETSCSLLVVEFWEAFYCILYSSKKVKGSYKHAFSETDLEGTNTNTVEAEWRSLARLHLLQRRMEKVKKV